MTTILLAMAAVKFAGGTPNDFVAALADATGQNVVMSQGDAKVLPKAEFETTDISEMSRAIRSQLQHVILPGNDLVLSSQMLPRKQISGMQFRGGTADAERTQIEIAYQVLREQERAEAFGGGQPVGAFNVTFVSLPPDAVKDGKVTFKTEKTNALQLESLTSGFSKPVKSHWIYQDLPVFLRVKDLSEADFLKWVGKAVGARLVNTGKEYYFELDPIEVRKRAVASIQAEPVRKPTNQDDAQILEKNKAFRLSVLNSLTPVQLTQMLAMNGASTQIELSPRSPLTRLALQRVRDLEQYQQRLPADSPAPKNAIGLMQRVDQSRPALLIVDSKFTARMEIPVVDQNGRPAGVVRL